MSDVPDWEKQKNVNDIADLLAFEDQGAWLYVAGDCTRAYSSNKLDLFTRQIVFLRPNTFVIFDRVKAQEAGVQENLAASGHAGPGKIRRPTQDHQWQGAPVRPNPPPGSTPGQAGLRG